MVNCTRQKRNEGMYEKRMNENTGADVDEG